ncbi:MAG: NAD-dependent epimerase/dehydratase family protein [Candidatus Baldrarchaeia archaeon]
MTHYENVVVTGGAGFLGSHLVDKLIFRGCNVTVIDNLSSGKIDNLRVSLTSGRLRVVIQDLKNVNDEWMAEFKNKDVVFHFAANPEVRVSVTDPQIHFEENLRVTFNVLEAMRKCDVPLIVFASTSTVYGDAKKIPTPEDYHPLEPISVYGAVKLACEVLIQTYSKLYGIRGLILRYANIIGARSTHGVIVDFIRKLRHNPKELEILGDGTQRKSYLHVSDAVDATLHALDVFVEGSLPCDVYNIGSEDWISVREIADIIVEEIGLENVKYVYKPMTADGRGWPGDVKFMLLDISKIKGTGWKPRLNSRDAVRKTVRELLGKE